MTDRDERLLAPVLTGLAVVVALVYGVVGYAFIASAWASSPPWCIAGLVLFGLKRLAGRR